ncbi:MAG: hypothetical protein KTR31_34405 [Myxococcales bacterium]|nr:hypothetical protein [Myxococcales bacterium]
MRQLHLRGGREADQRRATHRVVDALRTATFPGQRPGRVLVIRSLDLGRIHPARASQAMALRITEQVRRLQTLSVPWFSPGAANAPAVWFDDLGQARAAFLHRRVTGPAPAEWFWRSAVSDRRPGDPVEALLARWLAPVARVAARQLPPEVEVARIVRHLVVLGGAERVLRHLPASTVGGWMRPVAVGPQATDAEAPQAPQLQPPTPLPPMVGFEPVLALAAEHPVGSPVRRFLALMALVGSDARWVAHPERERVAQRAVQARQEAGRPVARRPVERDPHRLRAPIVWETQAEAVEAGGEQVSAPPDPAPAPEALQEPPQPDAPRPERRWREVTRPHRGGFGLPPPLTEPTFSDFGGLLFLVPVLQRLGLQAAFDAQPDLVAQAFGWRVLDRIVARLQGPADDAHLRAVAPTDPPLPPDDEAFVAPEAWREVWPDGVLEQVSGPGGVLLLGLGSDRVARWRGELLDALRPWLDGRQIRPGRPVKEEVARDARIDAWAGAALRWCRHGAELSPAQIVSRPAVVSATPTHVDVVMPSTAVSIDVRRWALDVDPGWVSWLGRVVSFHYVEPAQFDALRAEAS